MDNNVFSFPVPKQPDDKKSSVKEITIPMERTPVMFRLKLLKAILLSFIGIGITVTLFHIRQEK